MSAGGRMMALLCYGAALILAGHTVWHGASLALPDFGRRMIGAVIVFLVGGVIDACTRGPKT